MDARSLEVTLSPRHYQLLQQMAREVGKTPEALSREILEQAVQKTEEAAPQREAVRRALGAAGRTQTLSPGLSKRIIQGVTLQEVQDSLAEAGGKPLSEIVIEQRGPRP